MRAGKNSSIKEWLSYEFERHKDRKKKMYGGGKKGKKEKKARVATKPFERSPKKKANV